MLPIGEQPFEFEFSATNGLFRFVSITSSKWRTAIQHIIPRKREKIALIAVRIRSRTVVQHSHNNSQRPPVGTSIVTMSDYNLRRHVFNRSAKRVSLVVVENGFLAQAKVSDFDIARAVEQNILRFQIAVNNAYRQTSQIGCTQRLLQTPNRVYGDGRRRA